MKIRKKLFLLYILPLILLISVSVIYSFLTYEYLNEGKELVKCIFKENFRLYCPGCGGSRSLLSLLRFDIIKSFVLFPALPIAVIILFCLYVRVFISFVKNDESTLQRFHVNSLIIIPSVIILNFLLRNILLIFFDIDIIGDFIK